MKRPIKQAVTDWREAVAGQFKAPFRGEIYDFYKGVPMGRGFANQGQPFLIDSANYLREPMHIIRVAPTGKFVIRAAVQMLKTNSMIEQPTGYFIANAPGDLTVYLSGDDSAYDQAKARLMPYIRSVPAITKIIDDLIQASAAGRFDIATEALYLPNMVLRVWPLNESSTQRLTLRYVLISDAFLSKRTGLIKEAIARTTQHYTFNLKDRKVIIESQGGEDGDDFDTEWKSTDQRLLHIRCPRCDASQEFAWHTDRGTDFTPRPTIEIPSLDHQAWIEHWRPLLTAADRRHTGMKRGDDIKKEDGTYDERAVLAQTHYECFHCGSAIADTPVNRLMLDRSSHYKPSNPSALPDDVGFWWPVWAGQRIAWGTTMLEYLQAKQSANIGNVDPLRQWHQKREARSWSERMTRTTIEISPSSYDENEIIPDEVARNFSVDCQQDQDVFDQTGKSLPGWFWCEAEAVDKYGNTRQVHRGFHKSWESWIAVQKRFKIPNDRVCIDVSHWPKQIMTRAALEAEIVPYNNPILPWMRERTVTWILMQGSSEHRFKHTKSEERSYSRWGYCHETIYESDNRKKVIVLKKLLWSNFVFKQQLDAIRTGAPGMPKIETLPREKLDEMTQQMETGYRTYEKQMENEYLIVVRGKDQYEQLRPDVHYRDTKCQLLVRQAIDGMIGHKAME